MTPQLVRVHKQKYPGRAHLVSDLVVLDEDERGVWLRPTGGDRVGVQLLPRDQWWVAWWWRGWQDDPERRWVAVDVCTPPVRDSAGWHYDDLEIDVVGNPAGFVTVVDEDEFELAREGYPEQVAAAAMRTRDELRRMLDDRVEPFGVTGWQRLDDLTT